MSRGARAGQKEDSVREESHDQPNSKEAAPAEDLRGLEGEDPTGEGSTQSSRAEVLLALVGTVFLSISPRSLLSQHNVRFSSMDAATPGLVLTLGISFLPVTQSPCIC